MHSGMLNAMLHGYESDSLICFYGRTRATAVVSVFGREIDFSPPCQLNLTFSQMVSGSRRASGGYVFAWPEKRWELVDMALQSFGLK